MKFYPKKFKTIRESVKLTQQEVADTLDIKYQSVQGWESGKTVPRMQNIYRLSELFHCSAKEFADFEPEEYIESQNSGNQRMNFYRGKFKTLRESLDMTQEYVARQLGISRQSIQDWEDGRCNPRKPKIYKLAEILHCKVSDLCDMKTPVDFESASKSAIVATDGDSQTVQERKELIRWILADPTFSIHEKHEMLKKYFTVENGGAE